MSTEAKKIPPLPYPLSRRTRLTIMLSLIGTFCILAPVIVMYARGYTFDFKTGEVIHGGALSIETEPGGATIFLNDIPLSTHSPARLSHILPGNYHVKIVTPNFFTWEKDISIVSNETVYLHDIDLFAQNVPEPLSLSDKKVIALYSSPNENSFVFATLFDTRYELSLYHTKTHTVTNITQITSSSTPKLSWSTKGDLLRIESEINGRKNIVLLNPENPSVTQTGLFESDYQWEDGQFGTGLVYEQERSLQRIDLNSTRTLFSLATSTSGWLVGNDNTLWEYEKNVVRHSYSDGKEIFSATVSQPIEKFIDINESRIIGSDDNSLTLYRFGSNNFIGEQTLPVSHTIFFKEQNYFLAWEDGELWAILPNGTANLLNRFSHTIQDVIPLSLTGTLLIVTPNKVFTYHPQYNIPHELLNAKNIEGVSVDKKKREIFVLGTVDGVRGVWMVRY